MNLIIKLRWFYLDSAWRHQDCRYILRIGFLPGRTRSWLPAVLWGRVGPRVATGEEG